MAKKCQFFEDSPFESNKYYKTFITLIFDGFTRNNNNYTKYVFNFEGKVRTYAYLFIQVAGTSIAYGICVSKFTGNYDE